MRSKIGVLGAGIMGSCLALELGRLGYRVDVIDLAPAPFTGASLHNEGKLHLGYIFGKDPHKKTYRKMIRGSLAFSRIIKELTGREADSLMPSQPFHYFVPSDSQLDMDSIVEHFNTIEEELGEVQRETGDDYLGLGSELCHSRNSTKVHEALFSKERTLGSFLTEERSVAPEAVANVLSRALLDHPNITFIGNTEIISAERHASGDVIVETMRDGQLTQYRYNCAANCLWDDRLRLDETAGLERDGDWLFRYKVTINISPRTSLASSIPSATGMLGEYGDVVNHQDGSFYISWYPLCRISQTTDVNARVLHDITHEGFLKLGVKKITSQFPSISKSVASMTHLHFVKDNIQALQAFIPSLACLRGEERRATVGGGVIAARGSTDIDDPGSILHQRSSIGPRAFGTYITVDTGKYCMAPLFAKETAKMIADIV